MIQHPIWHTDPNSVDNLVYLVKDLTATKDSPLNLPSMSLTPGNRKKSTFRKIVPCYPRGEEAAKEKGETHMCAKYEGPPSPKGVSSLKRHDLLGARDVKA